jgi:hypothetical protein
LEVMERGAHLAFGEYPEVVAAALLTFLAA